MLAVTSASHINISDLRNNHRNKERKKYELYEEILRRCHSHICMINERDMDNTMYQVPQFIWGKPPIKNHLACIAYLIHNLRTNGFDVWFIQPDNLLISWREQPKKPCGKEMDKASFQGGQPVASKDVIARQEPVKNKEQKLSDINRSVFRPMPNDVGTSTKVYDEQALKSLQLLTTRVKKK